MSGDLPVVLLVDDECHILSALQRSLRREGYEILTAGSADEALALLSARAVDLIVSDQKMPGTNGLVFLTEVGRKGCDAPRVLLTGWPEEIPQADITAAGITAVLPKPWDDADLKATLRACLGR